MTIFELRRDRAETLDAARKVVTAAIEAGRELTEDETRSVDEHKAKAEGISRKIEMFELRDSLGTDGAALGGRLGPELPELDGARSYSIVRALRMLADVRSGVYGSKIDGLEGEVHQELAKHKPEGSEVRGILIPWALSTPSLARSLAGAERRDVTTTTAAGGIANILGTPLIEYLRNKMVMQVMGARVLTGLTGGTFSLPKQTGTETAYHVGEAVAVTNSNLTLGQVTWTPRTLGVRSAITRKTLLQSSVDVEMLVRDSMVQTLAREFDRVGINGSGAGQVPMGIMQDPNVPTEAIGTNGGAPTWAMVCNLEKRVAQANADFGRLGYITSNAGRSKMKQTTKIAASQYSDFLWERGGGPGEGEVNSYRAMASEQIPTTLAKGSGSNLTALVFGNFDSATYGLWSGIDVLVDPYTSGSAGTLIVNIYQDYDFQMRYEVGFAKCVDLDPS